MKKVFIFISFCIISFVSVNSVFATTNTEALLQYNRGIDYYKIGQYDESISCFRKAIAADPNYIDAYYNLGSVLEYLKQYDAALVVFKQILVRNPEDYESVYKAAWLSCELGDYKNAQTYLALIPPYAPLYKDAQKLLAKTKTYLPQPKAATQQKTSKLPSNNRLYENIVTPTGITSDSDGNIYIAQYSLNSIIMITPDNRTQVFIKSSKIDGPIGLATDKFNNMYVANYNSNNILKISKYGEITTLIANVKNPYYLYIKDNILFVSCQGANSVLKYKL